MSARANAQSRPGRVFSAGLAEQVGSAPTVLDEPVEQLSAGSRGESAAAANGEGVRCSPDPMQHTDRYRLVTPFSLRL
jgi:hypothetical protein